jgi:hypothetical protein
MTITESSLIFARTSTMTSTRRVCQAQAIYQVVHQSKSTLCAILLYRTNTQAYRDDPLSPSFGVTPDGLPSSSPPPTNLLGAHPGVVEAHNARVQAEKPATPEIVLTPDAGPSSTPPDANFAHNLDPSSAEDGYSGSYVPVDL